MGKVELLDGERKKVIDELTTAEQKYREALKVRGKIFCFVINQSCHFENSRLQKPCNKNADYAEPQLNN